MTGNSESFLVIGVEPGRHVCKKFELGIWCTAVDRNEECIERVLPYTANSIIETVQFIKSIGVGNSRHMLCGNRWRLSNFTWKQHTVEQSM